MKKILLLMTLTLLASASAAVATEPANYLEFQKVLDDKCSKCHSRTRVDQAMLEHRDLIGIQERMVKHGAELDTREQQVLGIFFRSYEVKKTPLRVKNEDPLAEYRSVIEARCSGCHSLDIVEDAMRQKREFSSLAQMMIKRGAVLNDKDVKIIQTFWGEPLK
jgi:uncharacterized membrane protein